MHENIYRDNVETAQVSEATPMYTWAQIDEVLRQCAENKRSIEMLGRTLEIYTTLYVGVEYLFNSLRRGIVIIGFSAGFLGSAFLMHLFWGTC